MADPTKDNPDEEEDDKKSKAESEDEDDSKDDKSEEEDSEQDGDDEDQDTDEEDDSKDDKSDEEDKSDKKSKSDDEEPKVRKSVRDHIIERKAKAYDRSKSKDDKEPKVNEAGRKAISAEIDPIIDMVQQQADERELQDLFIATPDARKMEKQIRKHMAVYKDTPVDFIYAGLMAKSGKSFNSADKAKADNDAKAGKTGGHRKRPKQSDGELKSAWDLTDEEFEKEKAKTMSNQ